MYLIDSTYFTGKYEIPNINESNGEGDLLNQVIDIEVRSFLQNVLGFELFEEFDSYVKNGVLDPAAPQYWLDLVNGVEYDSKKWNGLIYTIGSYNKSLLTNYVWTKYFVEKNRIDGNSNANVIATKNAQLGNPANQLFPIWNEFVYLTMHYDIHAQIVSLNQFIYENIENYPTANYVKVEYENRFL